MNDRLNWKGLATGIGSLPHKEAQVPLDLIFKYIPRIPFWPQLPKRDLKEGMVEQYSEGIPCLRMTSKGLVFDAAAQEAELEVFYEKIIAEDIDAFAISREYAAGLYAFRERLMREDLAKIVALKCHITGPFTFAAGTCNEKKIALSHDPVFMQIIIKTLTFKALWQMKFLREFGKEMIVFIDEPFLGTFGSAYTSLSREAVVQGLSELAEPIADAGATVGIHCCGNTDWSIFADVASISIINFDAFDFLHTFVIYADSLKRYLERGGFICWGVVPTNDKYRQETGKTLALRIQNGIERLVHKGVDKDLLLSNLLISPACGLGTLDSLKAESLLKLLSETSSEIL